jgi:hypothetical protein
MGGSAVGHCRPFSSAFALPTNQSSCVLLLPLFAVQMPQHKAKKGK